MVLEADTVVDPGTVVIESLYAVPADGAVTTSRGSYRVAVCTQLSAVNNAKHVLEVDIWILDVARIGHGGQKVEGQYDGEDYEAANFEPNGQN